MQCLSIRPISPGNQDWFLLMVRSHDLSGLDYHRIARIDARSARDLIAGGVGMNAQRDLPFNLPTEDPARPGILFVEPRPDPMPDAALWILSIRRGNDKQPLAYINDDKLIMLMSIPDAIAFPNGEPDWKRHDAVLTRFRIDALRAEADRLEARLPVMASFGPASAPGSVDLKSAIQRMTGHPDQIMAGRVISDDSAGQTVTFRLSEEGSAFEKITARIQADGRYSVVMCGGRLLREGHLSEYQVPGFTARVAVDIAITDPQVFQGMFGIDPDTGASNNSLAKLLALDERVAPFLRIEHADMRPAEDGRARLTIEARTDDEASLMAGLRAVFIETWGGDDGMPGSREGVIFEACLASNGNTSPDICGFEILDWQAAAEGCFTKDRVAEQEPGISLADPSM